MIDTLLGSWALRAMLSLIVVNARTCLNFNCDWKGSRKVHIIHIDFE